jgi:DNA-binding transcriptional LysR family regulator
MQVFVRVAELSSFTEAAAGLGMSRAGVSTAVSALETLLGTRLLHRTTRKVEMTQDGLVFYERCKALLAEVDEVESLFQRGSGALAGRLRVDMPSGFARNVVIPRLPAFLAAHPRIELELGSTDRRVDLVREGYDCVLRVGEVGESSLIARQLGRLTLLNYASPAYLAAYGTPERIEDLARHRLVHYATTLGSKPFGFEHAHGGRYRQVAMPGALTVNSAEAYEAACLAGLGIIQAPEIGMRRHLEAGSLVEVLPAHRAEPMPVTLLYPERRHVPRRVQAFMDWIAEVLREELRPARSSVSPSGRRP